MNNDRMRIPSVALGTWAWGDSGEAGDGYFGSPLTRPGMEELVEKAHAAGFNLWDTAVVYGMGRAESVLGELLKRYDRGGYQLSTKFTPQVAGSGDEPVAEMLAQSMARLGTDYIDLYWIHNPADVERWTPHLIPLLRSGRVRRVGVSNHDLRDIERANRILAEAGFRVEAVQNHYSLLYRDAEEAGILDHCRDHGIPFFAYMVLEQGALAGRYGPGRPMPEGTHRAKAYNGMLHQLEPLAARLASIGRAHAATAAEVAIAWALAKGTTPIVGVTKPSHVDALVRARSMALSADDVVQLEALARAVDANTRGWWEKDLRASR
ncbi:MAG: aldo/keto reductase [Burkholderiaceae bacterium]